MNHSPQTMVQVSNSQGWTALAGSQALVLARSCWRVAPGSYFKGGRLAADFELRTAAAHNEKNEPLRSPLPTFLDPALILVWPETGLLSPLTRMPRDL